jgi:DNA-binding transcriptional MocR family regulator
MSAVLALPADLLSVTQRFVLLIYANHANKHGENSFPGRATVAEETGLSQATVTRATGELRALGILEVESWPGRDRSGRWVGAVVYNVRIPGLRPTVTHIAPRTEAQGETRTTTQDEPWTGAQTRAQTGAQGEPVTEEPYNQPELMDTSLFEAKNSDLLDRLRERGAI